MPERLFSKPLDSDNTGDGGGDNTGSGSSWSDNEKNAIITSLERINSSIADISSGIDKLYSNSQGIEVYLKSIESSLKYKNNSITLYVNDIKNFVSLINSQVDNAVLFLKAINYSIVDLNDTVMKFSNIFLSSISNFQKALASYFGFDLTLDINGYNTDPSKAFSFSIKETFKEVLLDVYKTIDNTINPRSEDNAEAFDAALTNVKDNTFIGSAYTIADTVPNDIKNALTTDSSPVLTFKTAGVSNSYYSIPAKSYSVDFSWYAPFKGVGDTVVSCFMYLGFLVALWKRLPEIIHGAGVTFVGGVEFHENQLNDMINDSMANDYYEHLKANGGYDDIDDF